MQLIDHAMQWHNLGIAPIPVRYRNKRPLFAWKQYQNKLPKTDEIKSWFQSKFVNLAVITGHRGLVIIDFDDLATWQLWQVWIADKNPVLLSQTYRVKTRRGQHIYLFVENPPDRTLSIKTQEDDPKKRRTLIDIKVGGYCLCPPSIHPSGHVYTAINKPSDIMTVESLECVLPQNLLEKAAKEVEIPCIVGGSSETDVWNVTPTIQGLDAIQWIKQNRSIIEFFPHAQPSGGNRWYTVRCPFHSDNEPSGWLDVQRNRFGCQAGCVGSGIDIIDFFALLKNVDRSTAVRELAH